MANQGMDVGLVYGKARYRKLSISAGDENITALRATLGRKQVAVRYPEELVVATEISPGTKITIAADIKEKEVDSSNKMYHDGNVPKQGNYYFSNQSTYVFDEWKDVRNGITLKTAVADGSSEYSFKMPMVDMIIEGRSKTTVSEVDKVYARELKVINGASGTSTGKWPISSVAIKQGSSTKASGVTDASAYFWESPTDVLTIQATLPGTETGDVLQYLSGETPSNGNMKWYVRTDYYITRVAASDGMNKATDVKTSNIHLTRDMSYSFYGTSSTTRTEVVNASYADITVQGTIMGGGVTQSRTTWYDRWYWADTGHGELTQSRAGDIQRSISIKEDNQKNRYTKEWLNDKQNMILINEYGRIKKSAESVPDNDPSVTYISETYSGWFTKTSRDNQENAQSYYESSDNRGTISTIHTKEYSSYYSWEGDNPNRCGLVNGGNYGERMTSSDGNFTRIHMFSGDITYRGHNYEWWLTRDYYLTITQAAKQHAFNNYVANNMGSAKKLATTKNFVGSSINTAGATKWVNSYTNASVNWGQYIVTRVDQHWGIRDNENVLYKTTYSIKTSSHATKSITVTAENGQTSSKTIDVINNWRKVIGPGCNNTFERDGHNFNFRYYSGTTYTIKDFDHNTLNEKTSASQRSVYRFNSSRGYYWLAANFYRHSVYWENPIQNTNNPNGVFSTYNSKDANHTNVVHKWEIHTVAHITMPYLGAIGDKDIIDIKTTCSFMPSGKNIGYYIMGDYYDSPINHDYPDVIPENIARTQINTINMNSMIYENLYSNNSKSGSIYTTGSYYDYHLYATYNANQPNVVISNSTYAFKKYVFSNPGNVNHMSEIPIISTQVGSNGGKDYIRSKFDYEYKSLGKKLCYVYNQAFGTYMATSNKPNHGRLPDLYTVSMPTAFAEANLSSFSRLELGSSYNNQTYSMNPQNFTFAKIGFTSSNSLYYGCKNTHRINTATSSSIIIRGNWFNFNGPLIGQNNLLYKKAWNNITISSLDPNESISLHGELHDITWEQTLPDKHFTYTFLYESGRYNNNQEVTNYSTNYLERYVNVKEEYVISKVPYTPPNAFCLEDLDSIIEEQEDTNDNIIDSGSEDSSIGGDD